MSFYIHSVQEMYFLGLKNLEYRFLFDYFCEKK